MVRVRPRWWAIVLGIAAVAGPAYSQSTQCGSALLGEKAQPAVFQNIVLDGSSVTRMWELGHLSTASVTNACGSGCRSLTASPLCDDSGDCTAVTGIEWLNGTCPTEDLLPQTTVLLVEKTTQSDGGRWAAIKVGKNSADANYDLDAAAAAICGPSCAAIASPYVGGAGQGIQVMGESHDASTVTLQLAWEAPSPAAEALNRGGEELISSYAIYYARSTNGGATAPNLTGAKTGWTRIADTDGTKTASGYSTDTKAKVTIPLQGSNEAVYVALGAELDGTGDPDTDANCAPSTYISRGIRVYSPGTSTPPLVAAVTPTEGSVAGGITLLISGTGMTSDTTVSVGGTPATSVTYLAPDFLTAVTPAGAAGPADVVVSNTNGTSTLPGGYRYLDVVPTKLQLFDTEGNMVHVLEAGDTVTLSPTWENQTAASLGLTGHAEGLTGPSGATYTMTDTDADYGNIGVGGDADCSTGSGNCYTVAVADPTPEDRPLHWDMRFTEKLSTGQTKTWTLHVGNSFQDAPPGSQGYEFIEKVLHYGITAGCDSQHYCGGNTITRAQMAVFLLKARYGSNYRPPECSGIFGDVSCPAGFAVNWIEDLFNKGITGGCGGGNYCPDAPVLRSQMAVFLLKAALGSDYRPPACTGIFGDVSCTSPKDFAVDWIEDLKTRNITGGCAAGPPPLYCPNNSVTRAQMAIFLAKAFALELYGP